MLAPETRSLLTDALHPPEGYRLDGAVATTYSLDLNAMLIAPLAFAMFDATSSDATEIDPIRLLESVRRHASRIAVFCQAGGIAVPAGKYSPVHAFAENCVSQVAPEAGVFHPKVWAVRFVDNDGNRVHRVLVSSRNLSFDRSWDTLLRLDEDPSSEHHIDAGPLAAFLRDIPGLAVGTDHSDLVNDVCSTLELAHVALPEPFTAGTFLPRGFGDGSYAFPHSADKTLVISPFLTQTALDAAAAVGDDRILISRPETLDTLGSAPLTGWTTKTLNRIAEVHPDDEPISPPEEQSTAPLAPPEGLHAKTFVFDVGAEAEVVTGSGNLTHAGWHRNVELGVRLRGPRKDCGVEATLEGTREAPGLGALLAPYSPEAAEGTIDPTEATLELIESGHRALVETHPVLEVTSRGDDTVQVTLTTSSRWDDPGVTTVWLPTVPAQRQTWRTDDPSAQWHAISEKNVTPYLVVETTAGSGAARATRRCIVKTELAGDVGDRSRNALAQLLSSPEDVLRYLIFLLGDPAYDDWATMLGDAGSSPFTPQPRLTFDDYALFEPLVRAAGRDDTALERVASLVDDLRSLRNGAELTPDGFDELWTAVWEVHREVGRG